MTRVKQDNICTRPGSHYQFKVVLSHAASFHSLHINNVCCDPHPARTAQIYTINFALVSDVCLGIISGYACLFCQSWSRSSAACAPSNHTYRARTPPVIGQTSETNLKESVMDTEVDDELNLESLQLLKQVFEVR